MTRQQLQRDDLTGQLCQGTRVQSETAFLPTFLHSEGIYKFAFNLQNDWNLIMQRPAQKSMEFSARVFFWHRHSSSSISDL